MRKAKFVGQFYPVDCSEFFAKIKKREPKYSIAIVPHAGYVYCADCMAAVYSKLRCGTFVIIGPNHTGIGPEIALGSEDFETPYGIAEIDKEVAEEISRCKYVRENNTAHEYEHSIEVQLPWLFHVCKKPKIVPILMKHEAFHPKVAEVLANAIPDETIVIASSDLIHHGPFYGYQLGSYEEAQKIEKQAIELILKRDVKRFFEFLVATRATICGAGPIMVAMLKAKQDGVLLCHKTSAEVSGDYENWVGYAGICF